MVEPSSLSSFSPFLEQRLPSPQPLSWLTAFLGAPLSLTLSWILPMELGNVTRNELCSVTS